MFTNRLVNGSANNESQFIACFVPTHPGIRNEEVQHHGCRDIPIHSR